MPAALSQLSLTVLLNRGEMAFRGYLNSTYGGAWLQLHSEIQKRLRIDLCHGP